MRLLLLYPNALLPWATASAARAGIDLVVVPRSAGDAARLAAEPAVVEVLDPLDLAADPDGDRLRDDPLARKVDGVLTVWDPALGLAAALAAEWGLPGPPPEVVAATRNKDRLRRRMAEAGMASPRSVTVVGEVDGAGDPVAAREAAGLRYPVVVKPAAGFSSLGVSRADDDAELVAAAAAARSAMVDHAAAFAASGGGSANRLVIEEYLAGPELAVETFAVDGSVRVLSVGYKGHPEGPYFEESVYIAPYAAGDEVLRAAITRQVEALHAALGIEAGPTHTEMRLTAGGEPVIIDVGLRVGGSGVSHFVVEETSGIDLFGLVMRQACGEPVALPEVTVTGAATNTIVPIGGEGILRGLDGVDEVRSHPDTRLFLQLMAPGTLVRPYPHFSGYPAFVLGSHADSQRAFAFSDWVIDTVHARYE